MKIGDYVRFYDRDWTEIGQIVDEVEDSHLKVVKCKDGYYDLDNFIKSSPNIIDLIEIGDYVNGKKVSDKQYHYTDEDSRDMGVWCIFYENVALGDYQYDIKSIVTKEQFESMKYKVGD